MALGWNDLFLSGSVVDLTVSLWRARLTLKAKDLGIEDTEEVRSALSLGSQRLVPAKALGEIQTAGGKAQRAIDYHSLNFALIRGARYVPDATLPVLMDKLRAARVEFDNAVEAFMNNYETTKAAMLPVLQKALMDAAKTPEAAAAAFSRVQADYPGVDTIRASFRLSWSIYAIQGANNSAAVEAAADEADSVKDVMREMVAQLRTELSNKLSEVLALVTKGGVLRDASIDSAMATLDRLSTLNVLGDPVLTSQISALRNMFAGIVAGQRISDVQVTGLEQVGVALQASFDEAVAAAERNLTATGRRKINLAEPAQANGQAVAP